MKFTNPSVEYWQQESGMGGVWKQIARACRVSYQSAPRDSETDEEFAKRVIFKPALIEGDLNDLENCEFDNIKGHFSVLEHGTVYLRMSPRKIMGLYIIEKIYNNNKYSVVKNVDGVLYITTNMRVVCELDRWQDLKYLCEPTAFHNKRYTFNVITDIGVTRQMNRTRKFSITEESTRYCDYTKGKFGGELTFVKPAWFNTEDYAKVSYEEMLPIIENFYKELRRLGWKPEQARQVLPLGLKTQACYTAFAEDWQHFLSLRADNVSGKAHPNIQYIANEIKRIAKEQKLW